MKVKKLFTLAAYCSLMLFACTPEEEPQPDTEPQNEVEPQNETEPLSPIDLMVATYSGQARAKGNHVNVSTGASESFDSTYAASFAIDYNEDSTRIILLDELGQETAFYKVSKAKIRDEYIEFCDCSSLTSGSQLQYFMANDSLFYYSGWSGPANNFGSFEFKGIKEE